MKRTLLVALSGTVLVGTLTCTAADWPRFRGIDGNGISTETSWLGTWPGGQPKTLWKANVGVGFSSVTLADGRLFTLGHNGLKEGGMDTIVAIEAASGKELWRHSYPEKLADHYYEGGSSGTPTVDGNRVYTLSKAGVALCLDAASGKVIWSRNLSSELGLKVPEWGFAGAPHIHGERVVYNAGDAGLALDKATGKEAWNSGKGSAGYGTPVPFVLDGKPALAVFGLRHVVAVDPVTGKEFWRHPWKTRYDVNAADPVVVGDTMILTSGYGTGACGIRFTATGATEIWKNQSLRSHMQAPIGMRGHIYGIDGDGGDAKARLKCLEAGTGKVAWESPEAETGVLTAADGKLIWVTGKGELIVVKADPSGYQEIVRAQVTRGKVWSTPVLLNGRLYVRNWKGELLCLDVKGTGSVS
jgi:outer membrane protein assembly factor BamB